MMVEEYTTGEIKDLLLDIGKQLAKIEDKYVNYELEMKWVKLRRLQDYCYKILSEREKERDFK